MITFKCSCGREYRVADDKAGARVKCRHCGAVGRVGEAPAPPSMSVPSQSVPRAVPRDTVGSVAHDADGTDGAEPPSSSASGELDELWEKQCGVPSRKGYLIALCVVWVGVVLCFLVNTEWHSRRVGTLVGHVVQLAVVWALIAPWWYARRRNWFGRGPFWTPERGGRLARGAAGETLQS